MRRLTLGRPLGRLGFPVVVAVAMLGLVLAARWRAGGPNRVGWTDDLAAARRAATAAGGRPMLLDFTASWCPPCQEMVRTTWSDPAVAAAVANQCVPVRIDADAHPDLVRKYNVEFLPTLIVADPQGHEMRRSSGYLSADEFRRWLAGGPGAS